MGANKWWNSDVIAVINYHWVYPNWIMILTPSTNEVGTNRYFEIKYKNFVSWDMELTINGNSEIVAHVWSALCSLLITKAVINRDFIYQKRHILPLRAQYSVGTIARLRVACVYLGASLLVYAKLVSGGTIDSLRVACIWGHHCTATRCLYLAAPLLVYAFLVSRDTIASLLVACLWGHYC